MKKKILVTIVDKGEDDSTVKNKIFSSDHRTLVGAAREYLIEHECVEEFENGSVDDTDEENDCKIVDYKEDGVYYFRGCDIFKFEYLSNVEEV